MSTRVVPPVTESLSGYWQQGGGSSLMIPMCSGCRRWSYPELAPTCTVCGALTVLSPLRGIGTVYSYTVNLHQYHPDVLPPNIIALVEPTDDPSLHLISSIVDCEPERVHIGLEVEVCFESHGDIKVPVFRPRRGPGDR